MAYDIDKIINTNSLLSALKAGSSIDDIADDISNSLNEVMAKYKADLAGREKMRRADEIAEFLRAYLKDYHSDVYSKDQINEFTGEAIEDACITVGDVMAGLDCIVDKFTKKADTSDDFADTIFKFFKDNGLV